MAYRRHRKNINAFVAGDEGLKALYQIACDQPVLDKETEQRLALAARDGDSKARDQIILAHLKLAFSMSATWSGYPVPKDELVSAAMIGLARAVDLYDAEQGNRFSTYAAWWIRSELVSFIIQNFTIAKHMGTQAQKTLFFNLKRAKRELGIDTDLERAMSETDAQRVADRLKVTAADVILMDPILTQTGDLSLNAPTKSSNDASDSGEIVDSIQSEYPNSFDVLADRDIAERRRSLIEDALAVLDPRSQDIVRRRRLADDTETLEEVSVTYGVSRERIRQIEDKALKKIHRFIMRRTNPAHLLV